MSFFCGLARQILALMLGLVFLSIVTDASIEASRIFNASDVQAIEGFDLVPISRALNSYVNIFNIYGRFWTNSSSI